jgi:tetratricopeptide (TPR) repeat protein
MHQQKFETLLSECEQLVREGRGDAAQKYLSALNISTLPRELRLKFANLCRRTGLIHQGLRLLTPIVHSKAKIPQASATQHELAEYAVLLQRAGVNKEAHRLLNQIDSEKVPEVFLYKAFCLFATWDYESAIDELEAYLRVERREYQLIVGQVNLAACFVALVQLIEAVAILDEAIARASASGYARLHGNCLELRAQVNFQNGRYTEAHEDLNQALVLMGLNPEADNFFIKKWTAIIDAFKTQNIKSIIGLREESLKQHQWESVRDADRFALRIHFDSNRLQHLMFGTPFASYRKHICHEHQQARDLPSSFVLGSSDGVMLDLKTGKVDGIDEAPTRKVHRLIDTLSKDFYRPYPIATLFAEIFPDEHFDIFSSIHRVHQLLYRTRLWLSNNSVPIEIHEIQGQYSLRVSGKFGLCVPLERGELLTSDLRIEELKLHFKDLEFSTREGCEVLGISLSSFKLLISSAVSQGIVQKTGAARATRYYFSVAPTSIRKAA